MIKTIPALLPRFDIDPLKRRWRYAAYVGAIALFLVVLIALNEIDAYDESKSKIETITAVVGIISTAATLILTFALVRNDSLRSYREDILGTAAVNEHHEKAAETETKRRLVIEGMSTKMFRHWKTDANVYEQARQIAAMFPDDTMAITRGYMWHRSGINFSKGPTLEEFCAHTNQWPEFNFPTYHELNEENYR